MLCRVARCVDVLFRAMCRGPGVHASHDPLLRPVYRTTCPKITAIMESKGIMVDYRRHSKIFSSVVTSWGVLSSRNNRCPTDRGRGSFSLSPLSLSLMEVKIHLGLICCRFSQFCPPSAGQPITGDARAPARPETGFIQRKLSPLNTRVHTVF